MGLKGEEMVVFGGKIAMIFGLGAGLVGGKKLGLHGIIWERWG